MASDEDNAGTTRLIRGRPGPAGGVLPPQTRIGDYEVIDAIAVGGFGTVYHVKHTILGRQAALKVLHRELNSSADAARRFEREAKAVNIIQHPNVVDVFDFGYLPDGQPYFVMELLTGEDLEARIQQRGRLTLEDALWTLEPLCSALDAAHAHGIVHRDLKASNVFRDERPQGTRIVLLDFGVAKLLFDPTNGPATSSQIALGTPACMAPEQIVGGEVSARTDVYALGALTYHMLTGGLPFFDPNITMMQQMHMHAQRPRVSAVVPALRPIDDVIAKAMSRAAEDRYASASEFLDGVKSRSDVGVRTAPTAHPRLQRGIGVHLEILVPMSDLEEPDEALLDQIEAIGAESTNALRPAGFQAVLDASTTVLYVRTVEGDETSALTDTVSRLRGVLHQSRIEPRIQVSFVIHVDSIRTSQGAAKGGALLQLASWVPVQRVAGIVAHRAVVEGLGVRTESLGGDLVRLLE